MEDQTVSNEANENSVDCIGNIKVCVAEEEGSLGKMSKQLTVPRVSLESIDSSDEEQTTKQREAVNEELANMRSLCAELFRIAEQLSDDTFTDRIAVKARLFMLRRLNSITADAACSSRSGTTTRRFAPRTPVNASRRPALINSNELPTSCPLIDMHLLRDSLYDQSSKSALALLRGIIRKITNPFEELSRRRSKLIALVAFDVLGPPDQPVIVRLLTNPDMTLVTCALALVSVIACENLGRWYLTQLNGLLPLMVSILQSVALGSPAHVQALAGIQRLSLRKECAEAAFAADLPEWLASNIFRDCSAISDFSTEFGTGLLVNLSLWRSIASPSIVKGVIGLLSLDNPHVLSQVAIFAQSISGCEALVTALKAAARRTGMQELAVAAAKVEEGGCVVNVHDEKDEECYLAEEELGKLVISRSGTCPIDAKFRTMQPDSKVYADFISLASKGSPEIVTFQRAKRKPRALEKKPTQLRIWR